MPDQGVTYEAPTLGREQSGEVVLDLGNAGTATRFLAAASLLSPVPVVIDGNARMRQRPIGELGEILTRLGARVRYLGEAGCPPMEVTPPPALVTEKTLEIPTTQSSQFISALLLVAPWTNPGLTIKLTGEVTSASYIEMTVGLLERLGATVRSAGDLRVLRVGPGAGGWPGYPDRGGGGLAETDFGRYTVLE